MYSESSHLRLNKSRPYIHVHLPLPCMLLFQYTVHACIYALFKITDNFPHICGLISPIIRLISAWISRVLRDLLVHYTCKFGAFYGTHYEVVL